MTTDDKLKIAMQALETLATKGAGIPTTPVVPPNSTPGEKFEFFYNYISQMDSNVRDVALDALNQVNGVGAVTQISDAPKTTTVALTEFFTKFQAFVLAGDAKNAQKQFAVIARNISATEAQELQELWFRIQSYGLSVQYEFNEFVTYLKRLHSKTTIAQLTTQK